jgi:hypothetical protein
MFLSMSNARISWSAMVVTLALTCSGTSAHDSPYRPGPGRYPKFDGKQAEAGIVCNNRRDWGFVLRFTDGDGKPVPGLEVRLRPV